MKRIPRNRAIDIVIGGHIADIEEWVEKDRESLRTWLYRILDLGRMPVADMRERFGAYFAPYVCDEDDDDE